MEKINHILVICGEPSGDLNAAKLSENLTKINPGLKISAVGGKNLRECGAEIIYDIQNLSVIGFFDVIKKLPLFLHLKKKILKLINDDKPDAVILVDFSGFNLRIAKEIKKKIRVIYYTSPQVWASRKGRIKTIKKFIDKMLVFFSFEKDFYLKNGILADFIGHPLMDTVKPSMPQEKFMRNFGISHNKKIIALLPGSRKSEIENILPIMLKSAVILNEKIKNLQFLIVKPPQTEWKFYRDILDKFKLEIEIIEGKTYDCLSAANFCFVASGTATLESAIMEKPFLIIYKMNPLNYFLYRPQVKVPYIGMVNIVAGSKIIPEFIQFEAHPEKIAQAAYQIITDESKQKQIKQGLEHVKNILGPKGASLKGASIITDYLKNNPT